MGLIKKRESCEREMNWEKRIVINFTSVIDLEHDIKCLKYYSISGNLHHFSFRVAFKSGRDARDEEKMF